MVAAYHSGGSQDLQTHYQTNLSGSVTSSGSFVSAFTDVASYSLGIATCSANLPLIEAEVGGAANNWKNYLLYKGIDTSGFLGLNPQNVQPLEDGYAYCTNNLGVVNKTSDSGSSTAGNIYTVGVSDPSSGGGSYSAVMGISSDGVMNFQEQISTQASGSATINVAGGGAILSYENSTINVAANTGAAATGNNNTYNLTAHSADNLLVSGTGSTVNNATGDQIELAGAGSGLTVNGAANTYVGFNNQTLTATSTSGTVSFAAAATGVTIAASGTTLNVVAGSTFTIIGNNDVGYLSGPANLGGITFSGNNDAFYAPNPDGSKLKLVFSSTGTVEKDSFGYLSNGSQFDEATLNSNGSGQYIYLAQSNSTEWLQTLISFNTAGVASTQQTVNRDGTELVTEFQQPGTTSNQTYLFANANQAQNAILTNNWSAAEGSISWVTNQQSGTWQGSINITTTSDWAGTGDPLSGDGGIQWIAGLTTTFNVNRDLPASFLGNNQAAQNESAAASQDLNNYVIDPLVLNLVGEAVTTTAKETNGVTFDMLGDGTAQATGWITPGEGFLVYDPSGGAITSSSQFITDVNELAQYGQATQNDAQILAQWANSVSGTPDDGSSVSVLSQLASVANNGGVERITAQEASDLRVWVPGADGSGGHAYTLQQLGISEIDLTATGVSKIDKGNEINTSFNFLYTNGAVGQGADVTLEVAPSTTSFENRQLSNLISAMAGLASRSEATITPLESPVMVLPQIVAADY